MTFLFYFTELIEFNFLSWLVFGTVPWDRTQWIWVRCQPLWRGLWAQVAYLHWVISPNSLSALHLPTNLSKFLLSLEDDGLRLFQSAGSDLDEMQCWGVDF